MGNLDSKSEQSSDLTRVKLNKQALISEIDKITEPPSRRAQRVFEALSHYESITNWDVICFCAEYLGLGASNEFPWLEEDARSLARLIYTAHYEHFKGKLPEELKRKF